MNVEMNDGSMLKLAETGKLRAGLASKEGTPICSRIMRFAEFSRK